jgi:lambda family phage tail tape measure protein
MNIGSLSVKLGLVTVEWDQATKKAKADAAALEAKFNDLTKNVRTLASNFQALGGSLGFSAVGIGALMTGAMEFSNEIKDISSGFGISIAKTLQFRDALQTSGVSAEAAKKIMSTLFDKIQSARDGNDAAIASFDRLGISFEELQKMSPEQAINRIFDALASDKIQGSIQRVSILKDLLGKGGLGLSAQEAADKLHMSLAEYQQAEQHLAKLGEASDNLKTSMDNLKIAFAEVISPITGNGLIAINTFKTALYLLGAVAVINSIRNLVGIFEVLTTAISKSAKWMAVLDLLSMGAQGWKGAVMGATMLTAGVYAATKAFEGLDAMINKVGDAKPPAPSHEDQTQQILAESTLVTALKEKVALARTLGDLEHQQAMLKIDALNGDKTSIDLQNLKIERMKTVAELQAQQAEALKETKEMSPGRIEQIKAEFSEKIANAKQKEKDAQSFILAEAQKELQIVAQTVSMNDQILALQKEAGDLKIASATMDKYAAEQAKIELDYRTQIAKISNQAALDMKKAGLSDQERANIAAKVVNDVATADQNRSQALSEMKQKREDELATMQRSAAAQAEMAGFDLKALQQKDDAIGKTQALAELDSIRLEHARRIAELEQQKTEIKATTGEGEIRDQALKTIDDQIEAENNLQTVRKDIAAKQEAQRTNFVDGWKGAFAKYAEDSMAAGQLGADVFNSAMGHMSSALDTFVQTGKFSFHDFAKSVVKDILMMVAKFQMMQLVVAGMRAMGVPVPAGFPAKASGGTINGPTIVGENGPELFVPDRRGSVIPNNTLASIMGQPQPSTVFNGPYIANMSAIDTQSAAHFLAKNKQSVFAAHQSAARSVPSSR